MQTRNVFVWGICFWLTILRVQGGLELDVQDSTQKFTVLAEKNGQNLSELIFVDLNGDGADELVVSGDASYGGDGVAEFYILFSHRVRPENSPYDLSTRPADRHYVENGSGKFNDCIRLAKGDWNGDGIDDLAMAGRGANAAYIVFGNKNFTSATQQTLGADTVDVLIHGQVDKSLGQEMTSADVNGDGKDDLLITDSDNLYILFGGSSFKDYHQKAISSSVADVTYSNWGSTLGAGDINGDGRADLFMGGGNDNKIFLAKDSYTTHAIVSKADIFTKNYGGWTGPPSFNGADLNGDGLGDFVIVDDGSFKTLWGRKDWKTPVTFDLASTYSLSVYYEGYYGGDMTASRDINGDGIPDLAIGEDYLQKIQILFGRPYKDGTQLGRLGAPADTDILINNSDYHFGTWVGIGNVDHSPVPQVASGAWATGNNYAGLIQVCFLRPDVKNLKLDPVAPTSSQDLTATFTNGWKSGQQTRCAWFVNGNRIPGATGTSLASQYYKKEDVVSVEVQAWLPTLPAATTATAVTTVTVANSAPLAPGLVSILPVNARADQDLSTSVTGLVDVDGDTITLSYRWFVNGTWIGTDSSLEHSHFIAGDVVRLEVRCSDGVTTGPATSAQVTIRNSPNAFNDAYIDSIEMPARVSLSQGFNIRVTVVNIGTSAWDGSAGFRLLTGVQSPASILPGRIVRPGETYQFNTYHRGFSTEGNYTFTFQMEEAGTGTFGDILAQDIIAGNVDNAAIVSVVMPPAVRSGNSFEIKVTVCNTGSSVWGSAFGYTLRTGLPEWPSIPLTAIVNPGETYTFSSVCPGISTVGPHEFAFQMKQETRGIFGTRRSGTLQVQPDTPDQAVWLVR